MVTKIISVIFLNKLFNQNYKGAIIMAIDNGDFVRVNFTGKIKETDDVFDTTYDEIAQEAGIFDENKTYKAIPIVVGGNHLLPAIEEAIIGLEEGDTKHIEVDSDNAFGPRNSFYRQIKALFRRWICPHNAFPLRLCNFEFSKPKTLG